MMEQVAGFVARQRTQHASRLVEYRRGAAVVTLSAGVGATDYADSDANGVITAIRTRDYLLNTADLAFGGTEATPRAGDRIAETIRGVVHVFEVMATGDEHPFAYCDPAHVSLRVHTKFVGRET